MKNEVDDCMVSVVLVAYNHAKYIRQALDSVINQKTNFNFEILIHDDCSTDGTTNIIKDYMKKYNNIYGYFETENQYSKHTKFMFPILCQAKGKYIARLECDDYWNDENKLQKQFDFMESHPEYSMIGHLTKSINSSGEICDTFLNSVHFGEYSYKDSLKWNLFAHLSSWFYKNIYLNLDDKITFYHMQQNAGAGDRRFPLLLLQYGKLYVMSDEMSVYRYQSSESSFTYNQNLKDKKYFIKLYREAESCEALLTFCGKNVKYKKRKNSIFLSSWFAQLKNKELRSQFLELKHLRKSSVYDFFLICFNIPLRVCKKILKELR